MALMWRGAKVSHMSLEERMSALAEIAARLDILYLQRRRNASWHQEEQFLQYLDDGIRCACQVETIWRMRLGDPELPDQITPPPKSRRARR
jgi:hypothetical protein